MLFDSSLKRWPEIVELCLDVVTLTMTCGDVVIPSIQIGVLGSLTSILQYVRLETSKS